MLLQGYSSRMFLASAAITFLCAAPAALVGGTTATIQSVSLASSDGSQQYDSGFAHLSQAAVCQVNDDDGVEVTVAAAAEFAIDGETNGVEGSCSNTKAGPNECQDAGLSADAKAFCQGLTFSSSAGKYTKRLVTVVTYTNNNLLVTADGGAGVETLHNSGGNCAGCSGIVQVPAAQGDGYVAVNVKANASQTKTTSTKVRYQFYNSNCNSGNAILNGEFTDSAATGAPVVEVVSNEASGSANYVLDREAPEMTHEITGSDSVAQNGILNITVAADKGSADQKLKFRVGADGFTPEWSAEAPEETYGSALDGLAPKLTKAYGWHIGCSSLGANFVSKAELTKSVDLCGGDYATVSSATLGELFSVTADAACATGESLTAVVTAPLGGPSYTGVDCFTSQNAGKGKTKVVSDPGSVHLGALFVSDSTDLSCEAARTGVKLEMALPPAFDVELNGRSPRVHVFVGDLPDVALLDYDKGSPLTGYQVAPGDISIAGKTVTVDLSNLDLGGGCGAGSIPLGLDIYARAHVRFAGPVSSDTPHSFNTSFQWDGGGPLTASGDVIENPDPTQTGVCTDGVLKLLNP